MGADPRTQEAFRKCGCGPFTGVIKKVGNKFGFIESDSVARHFKKDVFVFRDVLPEGVDSGARVTFKLKLSDKGEPQAETLYVSPAKNQQKSNNPQSSFGLNSGRATSHMYSDSDMQHAYGLPNMQHQYYMQQMQQMQQLQQDLLGGDAYRNLQQRQLGYGNYSQFSQQAHQQRTVARAQSGIVEQLSPHKLKPVNQDIYKGIVKTLFRDKGFGFVSCTKVHSEYHRDVFLETEEIEGLQVGLEVEFLLFLNEKGQPVGKIVPPYGIFTGILKVYNNLRGYGFVECEDATRIYGSDVFIHKREVDLYPTKIGDPIEFTIFLNMQNQPQATRTQIFRGTIMPRGKFLFVACKETRRKFGNDVFLLKSLAKGYSVKDQINFTVVVNEKGQPQVHSVSPVVDEEPSDQNEDLSVYEGVVKSLGAKYGFLDSVKATQRYGSDVFLLVTPNLAGIIAIGDNVMFTVQMNEKNQPQAVNPRLSRKRLSSGESESRKLWSK
eukprot:GEMP01025773.1.p1 GENE.GEMP01025773.1~~GEMP01025773.1.p1  ORF type:complete len:507 (+),score=88.04 GEMP01025773.1:40-1521(+)